MTKQETKLVEDLFRSLEREMRQEFTDLRATLDRMGARLDKIAAGAHYVTRLVEWSEKQDQFQLDTLKRLTELDARDPQLESQKAYTSLATPTQLSPTPPTPPSVHSN